MNDPTTPHPAAEAAPALPTATTGRALTFGFGIALAMWCVFFIFHFPGVETPPVVSGLLLLLCLLAGSAWAGRHAAKPLRTGLFAALVASAINLLLLGSFLVQQVDGASPDAAPAPGVSGLRHDAPIIALGFLAACAAIGLAGGALSRFLPRRTTLPASTPTTWLWRFAVIAAIAFLPLILIGGAVTSTLSGMAVRGWPDSDGANMFLYPISLMTSHGSIFLEHSHRLLGSLVGLTVMALMIWSLTSPLPTGRKVWIAAVFALVCIQGLLGAARVLQNNPYFGLLHGVAAQVIFAMAVAFAVRLSPASFDAEIAPADPGDRRLRLLSTALLHSLLVQLAFGASFRHLNHAGITGASHALWTHAVFSLVVTIFAVLAGFAAQGRAGPGPMSRVCRITGTAIIASITFQFILGWIAFFFVHRSGPQSGAPLREDLGDTIPVAPVEALIRTLHQGNGALLLALATILVVLARRATKRGAPVIQPAAA